MQRLPPAFLFVSVCLFVASGVLFALAPHGSMIETVARIVPPFVTLPELAEVAQPFANDIAPQQEYIPPPEFFLHSKGPLFWGLQILVWFSAVVYLLRILGLLKRDIPEIPPAPRGEELALDWFLADDPRERTFSPRRDRTWTGSLLAPLPPDIDTPDSGHAAPEPPPQPLPAPTAEIVFIAIGLLAAAVWPWIFEARPAAGFLLASLTLTGILAGAMLRGWLGERYRPSSSLGILAGWAVLATCAAFASLLERSLGTSDTLAALVSLLILAVAAANIQLHLGSPFGFSVTVIWGLLGLIVATIGSDATVATAAALSITFVGVALVRVSS